MSDTRKTSRCFTLPEKPPPQRISRKKMFRFIETPTLQRRSWRYHDRCHDRAFDDVIEFFFTKLTRHDRRPKSVRDPSSRVWEAMRRVFGGLTRGSRTHRSGYENGDERPGRMGQPSVVFMAFKIKTTMIIKTERTIHHYTIFEDDIG